MELAPFILRPIAGECVQKYQKLRQKQRRQKQKQRLKEQGKEVEDTDDENEDDAKDAEEEKPKSFQNNMALAQPIPLKQPL